MIVVSGELGEAKPRAPIFHAALSRLGVKPSDAAFVGDRLELDVAGANAVGMRSIWLNRYRAHREARQPTPDAEINTLAELPGALRGC